MIEALIEAAAAFLALILEVTRAMTSAVHHILLVMLRKEERDNFAKQWKDSHMFKVGVLLSTVCFILAFLLVFPFWKWAFSEAYNQTEQEKTEQVVAERPKSGITFLYQNTSGNKLSLNISGNTARKLWSGTKKIFTRDKKETAHANDTQ
ncbi:MAG: hypothetical protein HQL32_10310 [Planctomycetes bacterium]|nr:hypothetical protein [Planctomycetota bacterium]